MNKLSEEYFNAHIFPLWNRYMEIIKSNIDIIDSGVVNNMKELGYFNSDFSFYDFNNVLKKLKIEIRFTIPQKADSWFLMLSGGFFPHYQNIRNRSAINHSDKPDFFHDFLGHVPMLIDDDFVNAIRRFSEVYVTQNDYIQSELMRLWFYVIEFGVLKNKERLCVFGGGAISSDKFSKDFKKGKINIFEFSMSKIRDEKISLEGNPKNLFYFDSYKQMISVFNKEITCAVR